MYALVGEFRVSWIIQYSPTTLFSCHVFFFSRNQISCYTRTRCSILIWICVLMIKSSRMIEIFVLWNSNKFIWIWVCEQINLNSRFDMNQSEQSLQVSFYSFSNEISCFDKKNPLNRFKFVFRLKNQGNIFEFVFLMRKVQCANYVPYWWLELQLIIMKNSKMADSK